MLQLITMPGRHIRIMSFDRSGNTIDHFAHTKRVNGNYITIEVKTSQPIITENEMDSYVIDLCIGERFYLHTFTKEGVRTRVDISYISHNDHTGGLKKALIGIRANASILIYRDDIPKDFERKIIEKDTVTSVVLDEGSVESVKKFTGIVDSD